MLAERALARLTDHQRRISALLAEARRPLSAAHALQMKELALLRWELTRTLREYQLFKHTEIFDPMIRGKGSARSAAAEALKQRCIAMGDAFTAHVGRWSLEGPASAWADYQREALDLLARIEAHCARELAEVRALLEGVGRTRAC